MATFDSTHREPRAPLHLVGHDEAGPVVRREVLYLAPAPGVSAVTQRGWFIVSMENAILAGPYPTCEQATKALALSDGSRRFPRPEGWPCPRCGPGCALVGVSKDRRMSWNCGHTVHRDALAVPAVA